jgi:hypothetical protein
MWHRGVVRKLTKEEKEVYTEPVNYITMVEAYTTGPFAMTPLRGYVCLPPSARLRMVHLDTCATITD